MHMLAVSKQLPENPDTALFISFSRVAVQCNFLMHMLQNGFFSWNSTLHCNKIVIALFISWVMTSSEEKGIWQANRAFITFLFPIECQDCFCGTLKKKTGYTCMSSFLKNDGHHDLNFSSVQLLNCFPSFRWSRHWLLYEKTLLWQHLVVIQASALQTIALVTNLAVDPWPLTSAISQSGTMTLDPCCRVLQKSWPVQCRHTLTLTDTPTIAFFTLYVYTERRATSTLIPGGATCWPSVIPDGSIRHVVCPSPCWLVTHA